MDYEMAIVRLHQGNRGIWGLGKGYLVSPAMRLWLFIMSISLLSRPSPFLPLLPLRSPAPSKWMKVGEMTQFDPSNKSLGHVEQSFHW